MAAKRVVRQLGRSHNCPGRCETQSRGRIISERGAKAAKRHQAVSGYWHTQATLARCCRIRSYLDSAAAHDLTALEVMGAALAGKPWLPVPAAA